MFRAKVQAILNTLAEELPGFRDYATVLIPAESKTLFTTAIEEGGGLEGAAGALEGGSPVVQEGANKAGDVDQAQIA